MLHPNVQQHYRRSITPCKTEVTAYINVSLLELSEPMWKPNYAKAYM